MNCPRCNSVAAFGQTTCQTCGASLVGVPETSAYAVPSGYPPATTMPGYPMPLSAAPTSVGGLSTATAIVFALVAVCQLLVAGTRIVDTTNAPLALLSSVLQIAIIPLFLVWFFMARKNAGLWGTHRYKQGWSIGAWFVPIIFLWFPIQIAADIWRASLPSNAADRRTPPVMIGWWICWLLAWFTGFRSIETTTGSGDSTTVNHTVGIYLGSTLLSNLFTAAAAILAALMVRQIGRMQETRLTG